MKLPKKLPHNPILLADILFRKGRKRLKLFLEQSQEKQLEILRFATPRVKKELLVHMPHETLVDLLGAFDPDEATDILQLLRKNKREAVLQLLSEELKGALSTLLEFDAETAAGLMTLDYVQVNMDDTIETVAKKFKRHEQHTGRLPVILVMLNGQLAGFLPGHALGFADKHERISDYVKRVPSISYAAKHTEVVRQFQSHPHNKVVVLGDQNEILGVIYSDDVLKLFREKEASTLYDFAGIKKEEGVSDSASHKIKNRYRWLIINLGTAFLAAATVGLFEHTLEKYVLLAIYMPIVAGMGGNAATQTLAVLVRGIALKQIELRTGLKTLLNEMGAGLVNGLINGAIVAVIVILFTHDLRIAAILAMAMVINLVVAGFFGTIVPLIMAKLGKDPASSATIFITTATDVLGFLVFLGLATIILG
jgi:magnesium transporter